MNLGWWKFLGTELVSTFPLPANDIYVSVKVSLSCLLEQDNVLRLRMFLSSIFWRNEEAMECVCVRCCGACSPRCERRSRTVVHWPGVGQSLMSHVVDATFGDVHQWLDKSVYCGDGEMRKQADLLVGSLCGDRPGVTSNGPSNAGGQAHQRGPVFFTPRR